MLLRVVKGVVVVSVVVEAVVAEMGTVEKAMEEWVGEREVEEWDTYGAPKKFLSCSTL